MAPPPSTRGPPPRRFIYLIMDDGNGIHTLHRIDTGPLFARGRRSQQHGPPEKTRAGGRGRAQHEPPQEATETKPAAGATLPRPLARLGSVDGRQFLPLGGGVEKIVGIDLNRHTVIFDTRTESVSAGPDARHGKWHANPNGSTWAEAGGRLYVLGRDPGYEEQRCLDFEALSYDDHREDWLWSLLPSPPFDRFMNVTIDSFADAGAGAASDTIRFSMCHGTYAFDAARASWRKEGDWKMPFHGRAQYVADYGLWFGFADSAASALCAVDLNVAGSPSWRHLWVNVDGYENHAGVRLGGSYLSYLGSGRFCVTRFLEEYKDGSSSMTVVVTAVQATLPAASATRGRERPLQMVSQGSVRYHVPVKAPACADYWAF